MTRKPIKAFFVTTDDPEECSVEFARTNVEARRNGANEIGADFGSVSCRRLPWADEFAGRRIPAKACIENGLSHSCLCCGAYVTDTEGPVFVGDEVYCNADCQASHEREAADQSCKS